MDEEIETLEYKKIFSLSDLPKDKTVLGENGYLQSKEMMIVQYTKPNMLPEVSIR